jgi:peptidoglycan/LPS O-acetylase OafA/YrhL
MSVGAIVKQVAADLSALVRAEVELAKAEVLIGVKAKARGAGLLAAAGALAAVASLGLLLAAGFALAEVGGLPGWAAALIVSGVLLLIAIVLMLLGRGRFATAVSAETTKKNVQEDVAWTKAHLPGK